MEECEQLLPGIPNEITIDQIVTRLTWIAFHILSSVSRGWQRAIQSHQVYDARVRSKSTHTLIAFTNRSLDSVSAIALFSMEDGSWYLLPPGPEIGIPRSCQCVSLDGKLYVLGGLEDEDYACAEVYVFDLAGQRQWKQCASMKEAREEFGCGVKNGKIYAFGGAYDCGPVCGSEVYDLKDDSWSPITPIPSFRFHHKVVSVGEEFFLHGGEFYDSNFIEWTQTRWTDPNESYDDDPIEDHIQRAYNAEVYHPSKDEWRIVEMSTRSFHEEEMVGGKLHKLNCHGIQVYDSCVDSWKPPQPFSFVGHEPVDLLVIFPVAAIAVADEVLALVNWGNKVDGKCLIKSQGVGDENKETVWQKLESPLSLDYDCMMFPIEL